jgi:septum formation protein
MHNVIWIIIRFARQLHYSPLFLKPVSDLERLNQYDIILASMSPRRLFLLGELGLKFEVMANNNIDESYPPHLKAEAIPLYLAKLKAQSYASVLKEKTILITADTIVWLNNELIGKPRDAEDAKVMLKKLSGKMHYVYTGVCIVSLHKETAFTAESKVFFRHLTPAEIDYYVDSHNPVDKAGAYGIQEWIGYIGVERIEGSFFNVMGLPVQKLYSELIQFIEQ